jgi:hypothetical protein
MDPTVTMAMLASGPGAWFVTSGIIVALNAALGSYFGILANKLVTLILPIVLVEAAIAATGTTDWTLYFIGILTGLLASRGAISSQNIFEGQIVKAGVKGADSPEAKLELKKK